MTKAVFQHHYSSFQSHDPSESIQICKFADKETFLIIIIYMFVETVKCGRIGGLKEQHLFEREFVLNVMNVFTVTLNQFNSSMLKYF